MAQPRKEKEKEGGRKECARERGEGEGDRERERERGQGERTERHCRRWKEGARPSNLKQVSDCWGLTSQDSLRTLCVASMPRALGVLGLEPTQFCLWVERSRRQPALLQMVGPCCGCQPAPLAHHAKTAPLGGNSGDQPTLGLPPAPPPPACNAGQRASLAQLLCQQRPPTVHTYWPSGLLPPSQAQK